MTLLIVEILPENIKALDSIRSASTQLGRRPSAILRVRDFRCWQILLQKSFWEGERKFLEPLMCFARGEVRDHIVSSKIDHGSPQWR